MSNNEQIAANWLATFDAYTAADNAQHEACKSLLLTPAPTSDELAIKLHFVTLEGAYKWSDAGQIMEALADDVVRLTKS